MSEQEDILVSRLINKDKRAFELVYNQNFGLMVSYAMRFIDTREEAEEIVQEVFVKFWDKCESLEENSSVKSYLYRSVHNTCLNQLKHEKVKDAYKTYVINYMEEGVSYEMEEQEQSDVMMRITEEINNLPPRCSEIFKLSRFEGLKYQEIADHLSISVKTVEVQMGKALKVLRQTLKDVAGSSNA
ncbi:MAG: RNA polymerase sigma-70 factor [Cyclobacteriaceae bacterium]